MPEPLEVHDVPLGSRTVSISSDTIRPVWIASMRCAWARTSYLKRPQVSTSLFRRILARSPTTTTVRYFGRVALRCPLHVGCTQLADRIQIICGALERVAEL